MCARKRRTCSLSRIETLFERCCAARSRPQAIRCSRAASTTEVLRLLKSTRISVVLTDLRLPGGTGMDVLAASRDADANMPVIVMTAYGTIQDAVSAMKDGAFDFLAKPVDTDHLLVLMERALGQRRLVMRAVLILKEEYAARYGFPRIIGEDPALEKVSLELQSSRELGRDGALARRERHRQRAFCARSPSAEREARGSLRRHQLCGHSRRPSGKRALRARKRRLYWRSASD